MFLQLVLLLNDILLSIKVKKSLQNPLITQLYSLKVSCQDVCFVTFFKAPITRKDDIALSEKNKHNLFCSLKKCGKYKKHITILDIKQIGRLLQTTVGHSVIAQHKVIKERCVKKNNGLKVFICRGSPDSTNFVLPGNRTIASIVLSGD